MIDFEAIKSRHTIESVLERRGVVHKRFMAPCPIHQEKHGTSFSFDPRRQLWNCFGACQRGGDVITLIEAWDGVDKVAACEILEGRPLSDSERHAEQAVKTSAPALHAVRALPQCLDMCPDLSKGSESDWHALAAIRQLAGIDGIALAVDMGVLRFATVYRQPAWVVLDVENPCNVQCSRLDGQLWFTGDKLLGVKGNWAKWPVGLHVAIRHAAAKIALVEGRGDFMAAYQMHATGQLNAVPVAMFGASMPIHDGALPFFAEREIVIMQQNDTAGEKAAARWSKQLHQAGAVGRIKVVPGHGNDLNDWLSAQTL